jgi:metallophosphoesterase (TIGR03767 family)
VRRALVTLAAFLAATPAAMAAPATTVERTIQDCDGDQLLEYAPGEPHVQWDDADEDDGPPCTTAPRRRPLRLPPSASILNLLQLTDFQTVDEESPARVEFLDTTQRVPGLQPFSAAYRPQESLTTQTVEAMVRQARNAVSPVTGRRLDLTMLTGDNADNQQYNETRWFIDILDGTTGDRRRVDPDSGIPTPACPGTPGSRYDGVRDSGADGPDTGYYEPDASGGASDDGDGYAPDRAENATVTGRDVTVRDFPGLFERANEPFEAIGLRMPWYTAFGNHDALVQGNSPEAFAGPMGPLGETYDPGFDGIARGCVKVLQPAATGQAAVTDIVPPDDRRCFLPKDLPVAGAPGSPCEESSWMAEHFRTTGTPAGHGLEARPPEAIANHDGYYAFSPRPGLRFAVLDTVTDECGAVICSEGSVDDTQFRWLERELDAAARAGDYVIVFSHHTLATIRMPSTDPSEHPLHNGRRPSEGETLEELYCAHPNLLAHVDGHQHSNRVSRYCDGPAFWEISTAAHIDWPQQSRMIELVDLGGELAFVLTMLDHDGPAHPGAGRAPHGVLGLASVGREIAYNDYQGDRGARGGRRDRNVILRTGRPVE